MRALVLSGGACFGAYQAGVWRTLEELDWEPDVIVGVSIGAVNAFALSRGASADELAYVWRDLPAELGNAPGAMLSPWRRVRIFRQWLDSVVERFGSRQPRYGMRAVMIEAPSLRFRMDDCLDNPRPRLEAACALPGVLPPVRVDGRWLLDCGAARHLPLREALTLGAAEIVAVDLLKHYPLPPVQFARRQVLKLADLLNGTRSQPTAAELAAVSLSVVAHPEPLGSIPQAFRWDPEFVGRLIDAGYADGAAALGDSLRQPVVQLRS